MDFTGAKTWNFDEYTIQTLNPNQIGVFGIFNRDVWVYIGRGDLKAELLRYVRGENPDITAHRPTGFCAIVTSDHVAMEKALMDKYAPVANKRRG